MRFYDAYEYEIDTSLCKTEKRLKDLYFENQDRHLEKPHDIKDCRDIFVKASQTDRRDHLQIQYSFRVGELIRQYLLMMMDRHIIIGDNYFHME